MACPPSAVRLRVAGSANTVRWRKPLTCGRRAAEQASHQGAWARQATCCSVLRAGRVASVQSHRCTDSHTMCRAALPTEASPRQRSNVCARVGHQKASHDQQAPRRTPPLRSSAVGAHTHGSGRCRAVRDASHPQRGEALVQAPDARQGRAGWVQAQQRPLGVLNGNLQQPRVGTHAQGQGLVGARQVSMLRSARG
jgi:hypothetical protein